MVSCKLFFISSDIFYLPGLEGNPVKASYLSSSAFFFGIARALGELNSALSLQSLDGIGISCFVNTLFRGFFLCPSSDSKCFLV